MTIPWDAVRPDPNPHPNPDHQLHVEEGITAIYEHPQGGRITVYQDGTMDARNAQGRKKKTSATPQKLADGHGAWRRVL
jgi:hypothetical protein